MHLLSTLSTIAIDLSCAVFILYCFTLLGHSIRSLLPPSEWTPAVAVLWDAYLGVTTAAIVITVLGMSGLFYPLVLVGVLVAGLLMNSRDRSSLLAPLKVVRDTVFSLAGDPLVILALALPAVIALIFTAVPEIFYDALYYHLGLPQQYLLKGKIAWDPAVVHSAFPAYLDVLFGLCLGIAGPGTAKFFNLLLFFLAWSATAAFIFQVLGERPTALIGTLTIAAVPGVVVMSTMCGIDTALIGFSAMSSLAIARARDAAIAPASRPAGIVLLGAVCTGFIAGSKYTGLWLIAALAPAFLASRRLGLALRMGLVFSAIALVVAAPWFVRNALLTGDPLYPALRSFLGDTDAVWTVQRLQRDVQTIGLTWTAPAELAAALIHAPARLGAGAEPGILLPMGAAAVLLGALGRRELRPWALALALYLLIWMSLTGVMRYLYPVFPLCALGAAWITRVLITHWRHPQLVLSFVVLLAAVPLWQSVLILNDVYVGTDVGALFSGSLSRDDYLARRLAYYPAAQWLNAHAERNARVLYLGETRLLYVERQVALTSAYDTGHVERILAPGAPPVWTSLKRLGVTHILIHGREIDRLRTSYDYLTLTTDAERQLKAALQRCRILFRQSGVQLCEIPDHEVS